MSYLQTIHDKKHTPKPSKIDVHMLSMITRFFQDLRRTSSDLAIKPKLSTAINALKKATWSNEEWFAVVEQNVSEFFFQVTLDEGDPILSGLPNQTIQHNYYLSIQFDELNLYYDYFYYDGFKQEEYSEHTHFSPGRNISPFFVREWLRQVRKTVRRPDSNMTILVKHFHTDTGTPCLSLKN